MCAPTEPLDHSSPPAGVFSRRLEANDYVKRVVTEGLPLVCFAGRLEITNGCCCFVTDEPRPMSHVALVLYREGGELRSVALRKFEKILEHAADRPIRFLDGQPEICLRVAVIEASGVYLLIDGTLARQALTVLRAMSAHAAASTSPSSIPTTSATPPS